jgi:Dolichyl-phosphate-mannose-protein mannosyltransferase
MSAAGTATDLSLLDATAGTAPAARWSRVSPGRMGEWLVGAVLVALSIIPVARYLFVVVNRIGYPYELEWTEGGSVEVVHRVVLGQGIYGPPSMHFTPWPYTPLYFWVSAAVAELTGIGFTPLRLVSFAASLVVLWLLYRMVVGETSDRVAGIVAVGVYAATFRLSGAWADIGRVDSLFLALTLWALDRSRRARTPRDGVIVGMLLFLSFFTKQDGLVVAVPVLAWLLLARRAAGVSAFATLGGLVVGSTVVLDAFTHGWYQYYVFDELRSQGWVGENLRFFWQLSILKPFVLVAWLVVVAAVALLVRERHRLWVLRSRVGFWIAAAAGLFGAAWIGRLHNGGFDDVLMPAYAGVALVVGGSVALLRRQPHVAVRVAVSLVLAGVLAAQLHRIDYPAGRQIPTQADARAGAHLIALIRHLPGQVLVFDHPYYGVMAGKGTVADEEAANDIERSGQSDARRLLIRSMERALLAPGVGAVILDDQGDERNLQGELSADYHLLPQPAVTSNTFFPVTDLPLRPTLVFVRDSGPSPRAGGPYG